MTELMKGTIGVATVTIPADQAEEAGRKMRALGYEVAMSPEGDDERAGRMC